MRAVVTGEHPREWPPVRLTTMAGATIPIVIAIMITIGNSTGERARVP
jgi:hypothetical protein